MPVLFSKPGFTIRTPIRSRRDHGRALRTDADRVQGGKQPDPEFSHRRPVCGQYPSTDNRVGKQPPGGDRYDEYHEGKKDRPVKPDEHISCRTIFDW